MIERLKDNRPASQRQIMFLRFWGRPDLANRSRAEVTAWMTRFIDVDERRKHAWNMYKLEVGDDGSQGDPIRVPIGIGERYLGMEQSKMGMPNIFKRLFGAS